MVKWDYKTVVMTGGFMGRHKDELRRDHFEQHLDLLGQQGWELAWILLEQRLQGEKDGHLLIFKRPLDEQVTDAAGAAEEIVRIGE